jgi:hypothetical protein
LAALFTKLGFTAFDGPAPHVALMEDQIVTRKPWLDRPRFFKLVAPWFDRPRSFNLVAAVTLVRRQPRGSRRRLVRIVVIRRTAGQSVVKSSP